MKPFEIQEKSYQSEFHKEVSETEVWVDVVTKCLCNSCDTYFEELTGGFRVQGDNEAYCPCCISKNKHYSTIRDYVGDDVKRANQIIETLKPL